MLYVDCIHVCNETYDIYSTHYHTRLCLFIYTCLQACVHMRILRYVCMQVCMYVCVYVFHICKRAYTHIRDCDNACVA